MPAFNGENYISQAIESVIRQKFESWELLVVDDGSTDSSQEIIYRYANNDSRIKYIHQENKGEFDSRMTGIIHSKGEYITGLDQDDYMDNDYLETIYECIKKFHCDCIVSPYKSFGKSNEFFSLSDESRLTDNCELLLLVLKNNFPSFWCKTIKSSIYKGIDYSNVPLGIKSSAEDYLMTIPAICECKTVYLCNKGLLYYRDYEASYSHNYTPKVIEDLYSISMYGIIEIEKRDMLTEEVKKNEYITLLNSVAYRLINIFSKGIMSVEDFEGIYIHKNYGLSKEYEMNRELGILQVLVLKLFRHRRYKALRCLSCLYTSIHAGR